MTYIIIDADETFTVDPRPVSLDLVANAVGPEEGPARIDLERPWGMAAWCNDRAYATAADLRNVGGAGVVSTLGAAPRPYCGTLVISGYDHGSDWGGPIDLTPGKQRVVEAIHADVCVLLAGGRPATRDGVDPVWADVISKFMAWTRTAELPRMLA